MAANGGKLYMRYIRPRTIEEATSLLTRVEGPTPLAGGTVLVPELTRQGGEGLTMIDIGRIEALRTMDRQDGSLHLGATVTLARLASSVEVQADYSALAQAAALIGNPNVRRTATVGGNLAFARPLADLPPVLLALGADVVLSSASGVERRPIARMITEGVPEGCLITAVNVPHVAGRRSGFRKFAWRQSSGKTLVSVAGALRLQEGHIVQPRLAVGGLCRRATRLLETEEALAGQHWSEDLVAEIARLAAAQAVCDVEGPPSADYRRRLVAAGVRHVLATIATS